MSDASVKSDLDQRTLSDEDIQRALKAVLDSPEFDGAERLQSFLRYVVDKLLTGQSEDIRAKSIAEDVYGRALDSGGDPMAVVRVDAGRMRRRLANFYSHSGKDQRLRIHMDPGGYVPRFEVLDPDIPSDRARPSKRIWVSAAALTALAIAGGAVFFSRTPQSPLSPVAVSANANQEQAVREALFSTNPSKLQAVNLASEARLLMFPVLDRDRVQAVRGMFERAMALDETYFGGYAGSAQAISILALTTPPGAEKQALLTLAKNRAQRALELAPDKGWSHSALALASFCSREHEAALAQSARATRLAPDDIHVTNFDALFALFGGDFQRAIASANRAQGVNTTNGRFPYRSVLASSSYHLGEYQASVDQFNEAVRLGDPVSAISIGYLAASYQRLGDDERARATILLLDEAWPGYPLAALFRTLFADPDHAEDIISALDEISALPTD